MWSKIRGTLKEHGTIIADAISGTIVDTAIDRALDDTINSIIKFFTETSPEDVYKMAQENRIINGESVEEHRNKLRKVISIAKETKLLSDSVKKKVIDAVKGVEIEDVIKMLLERAQKESLYYNDRPLECMGLIINSPICIRWLNNNLEKVKEMIIEEVSNA